MFEISDFLPLKSFFSHPLLTLCVVNISDFDCVFGLLHHNQNITITHDNYFTSPCVKNHDRATLK